MVTQQQPTIVERPAIKVDGGPLSDALEQNLIDARVELVSNGVGQATLRFYDADFELLTNAIGIGAALEISFPKPGTQVQAKVFSGEVLELGAEQGPNDLHELVITAFDLGHRLSLMVTPVAYKNMKYADIIRKIAGKHGLKATIGDLGATTFKYLLQTTDDRTFINEICERVGATWRVDVGGLVVGQTDAPQNVVVGWGRELRRFTTRVNGAGLHKSVQVRGWNIPTKQSFAPLSSVLSTDLSTAPATDKARKAGYAWATGNKVISNRITDSQAEGQLLANAVRERLDSGLTQARGEVLGDPQLKPGATVKVEGMGQNFSGTYLLTTVEHVYTAAGYVTRFHAGPSSASTLVDLIGGPARTYHGAMVGIVTDNADKEDNLARVKVKLPMFGDDVESNWARVITLGGGANRGVQITPAVNDEVIVIFEGGDLRRPIVLGGVWNGSDKPPKPTTQTTASGKTNIWHLQTAAGHKLTFDESTDGKENVVVLLKDGTTKLHIGVDKIELWASNSMPIDIKSGQAKILLDKENVTISANNITLSAKQAVKIEGTTVDVAGKGPVKVNGATVDVKGMGTVNVEASGMTSVKGAMVKIN